MNPKELRITNDNFLFNLFTCVEHDIDRYLYQEKTSFDFQFKVFIRGFNYIIEGNYDIINDFIEIDGQSLQAYRTEAKRENEVDMIITPDLTNCKTAQERLEILLNEKRNQEPDKYDLVKGTIL